MYAFPCDVDVQLSHQRFEGRLNGLDVFGFPFFAIFASRLSLPIILHDLSMLVF
jgi:hypothetical protein